MKKVKNLSKKVTKSDKLVYKSHKLLQKKSQKETNYCKKTKTCEKSHKK